MSKDYGFCLCNIRKNLITLAQTEVFLKYFLWFLDCFYIELLLFKGHVS